MVVRSISPPQEGIDSDVRLIRAGLDWLVSGPNQPKYLALNGMQRMVDAGDFNRFVALAEVIGTDQFTGLSEFQQITHRGHDILVVGPEYDGALGTDAWALVVYPDEEELAAMEQVAAFARVAVIPWSGGDVQSWKAEHHPTELDW